MSHHRHREPTDLKEYEDSKLDEKTISNRANSPHPFFQENDLMILSVINPFLSEKGQKILSFFMNFGKESSTGNSQGADIAGLLMQSLKNMDPNFLQNLVPLFLNASGNSNAVEVLQRFFPKDVREAPPLQNETLPRK